MASVPSAGARAYPKNMALGNTEFPHINPFCRASNIEIRGTPPRWSDVITDAVVFQHLNRDTITYRLRCESPAHNQLRWTVRNRK